MEEWEKDELVEELEKGQEAALLLCEHFERMKAAKLSLPIETENGCYVVEVKQTL